MNDAPKITREICQRLRWLVLAGGTRVYPRPYAWRSSVQSMLGLALATWAPVNSKHGALEITALGRRALAIAEAAARRTDGTTPRTVGPWA